MFKTVTFIRNNAIGLIALFVALGGTSYAAFSLPASSVGTRQLRNDAVTSRKLAKHAVSAANLDPKSIAGRVAAWAQIAASGQVASSSPAASVVMADPGRGVYRVSWNRSIPRGCIALANPANVVPTFGALTADTFGPDGKTILVETYDANRNNVPEAVNVVLLCP